MKISVLFSTMFLVLLHAFDLDSYEHSIGPDISNRLETPLMIRIPVISSDFIVCNDSMYQSEPDSDMDSDGNIWVVWEDFRHSPPGDVLRNAEVYARKISPQGDFLTSELRLTDRDFRSWFVKVSVDRIDNVHIVFRDIGTNGYDVRYIQLDSIGNAVVPETVVNDAEGWQTGELRCGIGVDNRRNVHVLWPEHSTDFYYSKLDSAGNLLVDKIHVSGEMVFHKQPDLSVGPDGSANMVFMRQSPGYKVIHFSKVDSSGNLIIDSKPLTPESSGNYCSFPAIVTDNAGNSHLLFDYRDTSLTFYYDPFYLKIDQLGNQIGDMVNIIDYNNGLCSWGIAIDLDGSGSIHAIFNQAINPWTFHYSYAKIADGGELLSYIDNISDNEDNFKEHHSVAVSGHRISLVWENALPEAETHDDIYLKQGYISTKQ